MPRSRQRVFICFFVILFSSLPVIAQEKATLKGRVTNCYTNEPIENASVMIQNEHKIITDTHGCFERSFVSKSYVVQITHHGYDTITRSIALHQDTLLQFCLTPSSLQLREVTVLERRTEQNMGGLPGGRIELNMNDLRFLPKFLGNSDPLKILQLMPGVQTSGDGNSGTFIRGAEPGHNLILWNDAPIYNVTHLLGLFSVFNSGHIGEFKLHKSNISAEYGGRLSSLIEVKSPTDIPKKTSISGDIGLISSQATLSLPIGKKSALYLSGRRTYIGLLLKPIIRLFSKEDMPFDYEFQDYNLTFVTRPTKRDVISVNAYFGTDHLELQEPEFNFDGTINWRNIVSSISWEHEYRKNIKMSNSFFVSQYNNQIDMIQGSLNINLPSYIRDIGYRGKVEFSTGSIKWSGGAEYIHHTLSPQIPIVGIGNLQLGNAITQLYRTHEIAIFANSQFRISKRLLVEAGIRYVFNLQSGPYNDQTYNDLGEIATSYHWNRGEIIDMKQAPEPRINFKYQLPSSDILQISYNRNHQFINLVAISNTGLAADFWLPSSKNIPMQASNNFSMGYFRTLKRNEYEISAEVYYRTLSNQMEFKSTLLDLFNQQYILEESMYLGKGKAYGLELMVKKNGKKFSGWLSYTLGWSKRNFPDIMNNKTFPAKHDRRHDLSIAASYKLNKKWDFSSVFVFASGSAFTAPNSFYMASGNIVKEYGDYNGARMPAYHRLDISANYWFIKKQSKESGINFSIHNVYKNKNPLYIFIITDTREIDNKRIIMKERYRRIYDIIPSISWMFKF